ncbi:hypothetical protein [Sphingomonas sp. Y38-1Y]|uniref:hypothetical protein n=1 Tax=Sphingomonas sp. Y38-1Y TaxID=3078265 RepID=UPI0028E41F7E|nr:hypothetical protein [Sphingomonas sp. Y38-1Y]
MIADDVSFEARPRRRGRGLGLVLALLVALIVGGIVAVLWVAPAWERWRNPAASTAVAATPAATPTQAAQPPAEPGTDLTSLYAREIALAARLEALETQLAGLEGDSRVASAYATRAEGVLVAFAARRALDRGLPLGYVDAQLRERFGATQPRAVAAVTAAAATPVTIEDLRMGLDSIGPTLLSGRRDGWWPALRRELAGLLVLREETTPSARPADRLTRARRLVDAGQVEAAMAEVARMPGASGAQSWLTAAQRYVTARRALGAIEATALSLPDPPAAPALPAAEQAPAQPQQ